MACEHCSVTVSDADWATIATSTQLIDLALGRKKDTADTKFARKELRRLFAVVERVSNGGTT